MGFGSAPSFWQPGLLTAPWPEPAVPWAGSQGSCQVLSHRQALGAHGLHPSASQNSRPGDTLPKKLHSQPRHMLPALPDARCSADLVSAGFLSADTHQAALQSPGDDAQRNAGPAPGSLWELSFPLGPAWHPNLCCPQTQARASANTGRDMLRVHTCSVRCAQVGTRVWPDPDRCPPSLFLPHGVVLRPGLGLTLWPWTRLCPDGGFPID